MIREIQLDKEFKGVLSLYQDAGWKVYAEEPKRLKKALENSSYILGHYEENTLIGMIRGLTDTEYLHYIQDIIVLKSHHNKGVGTKLLQYVKDQYKAVRMDILLTDDDPAQLHYYEKNNFSNTKTLQDYPLNCFVDFKNN